MKREHDFQRKLLSTRRETRQFLEFLVTTILMVLTSIMILRRFVYHFYFLSLIKKVCVTDDMEGIVKTMMNVLYKPIRSFNISLLYY